MEVKMLYRRMDIDGKRFYQLFRIVDKNEIINNVREYSVDKNAQVFYLEAKADPLLREQLNEVFLINSKGQVEKPDNFYEINIIKKEFWKKYGDFLLTPKNEIDLAKLRSTMKNEIYYHDEAIEQLLNVIKSNQDVLDSDIDDDLKEEMVHNILLYGPSGYGKSLIIKTLARNLPLNCVILNLSSNPKENLHNLATGLITSANGDLYRAERGVVFIEDNFDDLDQIVDDDSLSLLEQLMNNHIINMSNGSEVIQFDLTKLTFILEKVTADDEISCLIEEGISENLYNSFKKIINISALNEEQVKDIILNHKKGVVNVYKKILAPLGKKLVVEEDFIDKLIEEVLNTDGGIKTIYHYIESIIKSKWHLDIIVLSKDLLRSFDFETDSMFNSNVKNELSDNEKNVTKIELVNPVASETNVRNRRADYKSILERLKEYVKGQEGPLMEILYQMFINDVYQSSDLPIDEKCRRIKHLLIRGGTGTGKTYISTLVAESFFNKPYIVVDCKQYTEAGFVGKSVEDMLIQLYNTSGRDIDKAQSGVIILDEFDKLASSSDGRGDSVNRGGVQESFLKLLEGSVFEIELDRFGSKRISFDTRNLIFICLGAFENLDKIKENRIKKSKGISKIGFAEVKKTEELSINDEYTMDDMKEFGIHPQLLRRITFQKDLNKLDRESYRSIMLESKSSAFLLKIEQLNLIGTKVSYDDEFVECFLDHVVTMGYGASSIDILINNIFKGIEIKAFMEDYEIVILNKECVNDPSKIVVVPRKHFAKRKA